MEERHADTRGWLNESRAYTLALRIASTPDYGVLELRRAWSAMHAWQVTIEDCRTGERLLLLSEAQFDSRLAADMRTTTAQTVGGAVVP